jgi:CheY-like chemotaxis protein/anti-sigma regulatory factor (Ser/Thr protein kinase)
MNAIDVTRPLIDSVGHRLVIESDEGPMMVRGDAVRLTQVVANLLNNAAKYTHRGGSIDLSLRREPAGFCVVVRDTGIGIAPDAIGTIFDPFTQLPARQLPAAGGLGVGLTLVKRLIELHGGRVEASSAGVGRGSVFTVHLPRLEGDVMVPAVAAPTSPRPHPSRRVLIVDDNVDAAEGLRYVLRLRGHEAEVVHDGEQAVEVVSRQLPDVVLLDISMPVIDGLEVARRVRATLGARRPLLVAVTGLGMPDDVRRTARAGFDHHLVKPIDFPSLEELLATARLPGR